MRPQSSVLIAFCCCVQNCTTSTSPAPMPGVSANVPSGSPPAVVAGPRSASLPLQRVADVPLPGKPVRFDYQDIDAAGGNLVIAHMNDASVVVAKLSDGSTVREIGNIPRARGVAVGGDVGRIFITSAPNRLVILDKDTFAEVARVETGAAPDGVAWDGQHRLVGVSDQGDGAASLIADAGTGKRRQVPLGSETGNIVYDPSRGLFWITVVPSSPPDQLVAIDPLTASATLRIPLPGCSGAHGLRLHADARSAFIACEGNAKVARVDLASDSHGLDLAATGEDPDVLAIDPGLSWLYVAAESGELTIFDISKPALSKLGSEHPGERSHSVAVDPATHHVFFPLERGPSETPTLRIMKPTGT